MAAARLLGAGMGLLRASLPGCRQAYRSSLGVLEQVRSYYVDWRMVRDVKRRQMAFEYADTRLRINAIRKNTILPKELQLILGVYDILLSDEHNQSYINKCPGSSQLYNGSERLFLRHTLERQSLVKEIADKEIAALPRDSCPVRIRNRCVMTSRPRGVKRRWRLSRIVFRHLADHNQMSGIQRSMW